MKYLIPLLLLAGCGPDISGKRAYKADCLTFYSDIELDQSALEWNAKLARRIMTERGTFSDVAFSSKPGFCDYYASTPIIVENKTDLGCVKDDCRYGYFSATESVHITAFGYALVHELYHVKDAGDLAPGTFWHENWDKNGHYADSETYDRLNRILRQQPSDLQKGY